MAMLTIDEDTFKVMLKRSDDYDRFDQYCNNHFYYSEWKTFTLSERRKLFFEYVDESDIQKLIEDRQWVGLFKEKPSIVHNELVIPE